MKVSSWYRISAARIEAAIETVGRDAPDEQLLRAITEAWPAEWGERKRWPYQQFLKARRDALMRIRPRLLAKPGSEGPLFGGSP